MIDIDLLDEQLEQALTYEVRMLRGVAPTPASAPDDGPAPPPAPAGRPAAPAPAWQPPSSAAPAHAAAPQPPAPATAPATAPSPQVRPAPRPPVRDERPPARPARFRPPKPPARATEAHHRLSAANLPTFERPLPPPRRRSSRVEPEVERPASGPAPAAAPVGAAGDVPASAEGYPRIAELMVAGELDEADRHIAAHAAVTRLGTTANKRDSAGWAAMRALLDGRRDDARVSIDQAFAYALATGDPDANERHWAHRFWYAAEWGDEQEQFAILDHCRERAYRHGDLAWRGLLTLQLARLARVDEAARELETTVKRLEGLRHDRVWLSVATDLAEAVALLGDARRAKVLAASFGAPRPPLVVAGPPWICKGAYARFQAHIAWAMGDGAKADERFFVATETHRRLRADPLLARTLREWASSLTGRDDVAANRYLAESAGIAARLQLTRLAA